MGKLKNDRHELFCLEYMRNGRNATKAYMSVYPESDNESSQRSGNRLLRNAEVGERLKELGEDVATALGIDRTTIAEELLNIAQSSQDDIRDNWGQLKNWEDVPDNVKKTIAYVQADRRIQASGDIDERIKIAQYDKLKAIEQLTKMLGWNAPEKVEHTGEVKINLDEWK